MRKKLFGFLLTLCLLVCALSMQAFAAEETASGSCGENVTWHIQSDGFFTKMYIRGSGPMMNYTAEQNDLSRIADQYGVQIIYVKDGVTSVGDYAFYYCDSVTNVFLDASVSSIGDRAFSACMNLLQVEQRHGCLTNIGNYAFDNCHRLNDIMLPDTLTNIGDYAFMYCRNLQSVDFPKSLKDIGEGAFINCIKLNSVTLPDTVETIGKGAFRLCKALTEFKLSGGAASIGDYAFFQCEALKTVILPEGLTAIGDYAFQHCIALEELVIPGSVTDMGEYMLSQSAVKAVTLKEPMARIGKNAFSASELESITIPATVTEIGNSAFKRCGKLTNVHYEGTEDDWHIISIGGENEELMLATDFYSPDFGKLTWSLSGSTLTVSGKGIMKHYGDGTSGMDGLGNRDLVRNLIIEEGVTSIGRSAFVNFSKLQTVSLPNTLTSIGESAFNGCSALTSIVIPDSVTHMGDFAFNECKNLKTAALSASMTTIPQAAFFMCSKLETVVIPASIKTVENDAFEVCNQLSTVEYGGTQAQWKQVEIKDDDSVLRSAEVTCAPTPPTPGASGFYDVQDDVWFAQPVLWAKENGVTGGKTETTFAPDDPCTRAQVVTFLYAAAGKPQVEVTENPFEDVSESDWYYLPVMWAVSEGITGGVDATHFAPNKTCTRAQVVTFLYAAAAKPALSTDTHPFTDVKDGDWYLNPVLWAVEKGVTGGKTATTFAPNENCTRAQVVTFLYAYETK